MADPLQVIGAMSITTTFLFICFLLSLWKRTPTIHSFKSKHVLISGGSSGLGLEIAKQALAQGSYVTIIPRNLSNLQKAIEEILKEIGFEKDSINLKVLISLQQKFLGPSLF
jgi:3-dehydrosphinganine reductase